MAGARDLIPKLEEGSWKKVQVEGEGADINLGMEGKWGLTETKLRSFPNGL